MCFFALITNMLANVGFYLLDEKNLTETKKLLHTAVWCKGLSELSYAILESFNILCNLWFKIIHLRKSGLHIDIVVESM